MTPYLLNFVVYTCAMVGMIFCALFIYKKFSIGQTRTSPSNFLEAEDCLNLGVRKQLYVVRAGEERFLIASDTDRTSLIAKLEGNIKPHSDKFKDDVSLLNGEFSKDMDRLYSDYKFRGANTSEVLRNIISTGERHNG